MWHNSPHSQSPQKQQWFKHLESVLSAIIQQYSWVLHQVKTNKQKRKLQQHSSWAIFFFLNLRLFQKQLQQVEGDHGVVPIPPSKQFDWPLCFPRRQRCPDSSSNRRSRVAVPSGCAPPRLLSRRTAFPENQGRTVVLWSGSWQPCGRCSGRNGTSWAGVVACTLWHGGPGRRSCSTYKSREHSVRYGVPQPTVIYFFSSCYHHIVTSSTFELL